MLTVCNSLNAEDTAVGGVIDTTLGKIVEGVFRHPDDMIANEADTFPCTVFGMLERAFPFEHGPAVEVMLGQLGKHGAEIDLAIAEGSEPPRSLDPAW